MMQVLEFIFRDFWTFVGALILLGCVVKGVAVAIRGWPPPSKDDGE